MYLGGFGAFLMFCQDRGTLVPTVLGGGAATVTWSTLVPLLWAAAVAGTFDSRNDPVEDRRVRKLGRLDSTLFICGSAGLGVVALSTLGPPGGTPVFVHAASLGGIAATITSLASARDAIMAATVTTLVTLTYSPRLPGAEIVRFVEPDGDAAFALAASLFLTVTAVCALLWTD